MEKINPAYVRVHTGMNDIQRNIIILGIALISSLILCLYQDSKISEYKMDIIILNKKLDIAWKQIHELQQEPMQYIENYDEDY